MCAVNSGQFNAGPLNSFKFNALTIQPTAGTPQFVFAAQNGKWPQLQLTGAFDLA